MTFNYMIGRLGAHVLARLPAVGCATLSRAQSWLKRWGKWLLVFGCFVPGLRHVTPLAAGSAQLGFRTFCAYGYAGAALWSTTFIAIGYYAGAGHDWTHASFLLRGHHVLVAIALGGVLAFTSEAALGDGSRTRDASADLQRLDTRAADRRERQCAHLRAPWPLAHA